MKVIVIGSGGREHAICVQLAKSSLIEKIICVPGNGGTYDENKCCNIKPASSGIEAMVEVGVAEKCDLAVIGPEDPLSLGIADLFWAKGIPVVGPCKEAAQLEASKDFAKTFMKKHGVACAESETFDNANAAHEYINKKGAPIVIKADGLAAGKGVVVATDLEMAHKAIDDFMTDGTLGIAGNTVVIEEYLQGVEISVLAAVSVTKELALQNKACIIPFKTARDHKRLLDGAKGPNTGGMGAIAPVSDVTKEQYALFEQNILTPTLNGLISDGFDYRGFIFFGIMLTKNGPKLLEYNVRLGDPETQAVLPLMDFDFAQMCSSITDGTLCNFNFAWKQGFVCAPVIVSEGYPGKYKKDCKMLVNKAALQAENATMYVAGAQMDEAEGVLKTSGGRVVAVSAFGNTFEQAFERAYNGIKAVSFDGMFYRKDIGLPGAAESL